MFRYRKSTLLNVSLVLLLFLYCFAFYLSGSLDSSASLQIFEDWIPYDSIQYVEKSENLYVSNLSVVDIATGALNWLSLSFMYKILNDIGGLAPLGFILINCLCFYLMTRLGANSASRYSRLSPAYTSYYPIYLFLCSPFLLVWILVPNKELIVSAGILGLIYAVVSRRMLLLVFLSLVLGLLKIQIIFATVLYLAFRNIRWRKTFVLVSISLIYPLLHSEVPGLQMAHFMDVNPNEIRSAPIFLAIDNIASYPFGYIVAFLARLTLNLVGGLYPYRIVEAGYSMSALAPLASFVLALLVITVVIYILKRRDFWVILNSNSERIFYLFCLLVVYLAVPFLQPRYYWWIIPILLSYLAHGRCAAIVSTQSATSV